MRKLSIPWDAIKNAVENPPKSRGTLSEDESRLLRESALRDAEVEGPKLNRSLAGLISSNIEAQVAHTQKD